MTAPNNQTLRINNSEKYINPYNFISLPKNCDRQSSKERKGDLTGYIECTLKAETPIMVPDTNDIVEEQVIKVVRDREVVVKHKHFKFFNYGNQKNGYIVPVIPGSEIRGMIRSDYEVFTNSCMSTLNKDINFISRTTEKNGKLPGILVKSEEGNWELFEAKRYNLHTCRRNEGRERRANGNNEAVYMVNNKNQIIIGGKSFSTGENVKFSFKTEKDSFTHREKYIVLELDRGNKEGILFIGETGGRKTRDTIYDSIFENTGRKVNIEFLNEEVKKLEAIYDMYNNTAFNQKIRGNGKTWYAGYDIKNGKVLPVWYSKPVDGRTYLSLASIGKEAYHRKISELVGDFMPCIDTEHVCNCCNLFGFVSDTDLDSSKIRVSDAIYENNDNPYHNEITIKELSSPHIANATFYALYAPSTGFQNMPQTFDFNYDVKIDSSGKHIIDSKDISIRGRKQYWHHSIENAKTNEKTDRNCTIKPVKEGTEFKFNVYFNDINRENLEELISVLNLKYKDKNLSHKIGKGKPLGFGSCKIKVDEVYIRDLSLENNILKYEMKNYNMYFKDELANISLENFSNMDTVPMKEALRIYNFDYINTYYSEATVEYPRATKGTNEASMYWFMLNKSTRMSETYVLMVLPRIIDGKEKDENGNIVEGLKEKDICDNRNNRIGKTHGLILPKYEM